MIATRNRLREILDLMDEQLAEIHALAGMIGTELPDLVIAQEAVQRANAELGGQAVGRA